LSAHPSPRVPRAAVAALIHIHFEDFVDLVDRRWAEGLDLSRAIFEEPEDSAEGAECLMAEVPAQRGAPRHLLIRIAGEGEERERTEHHLLSSYLARFVSGRTPDRLLAVSVGAGPAGVRRRWIVDGLGAGLEPLRLSYLAVELGSGPEDVWIPASAPWATLEPAPEPSALRRRLHLTSPRRAGNLRPFHTPFRREPPCNSAFSVYPSRARRRCSIP
jgi:hypothetical protein